MSADGRTDSDVNELSAGCERAKYSLASRRVLLTLFMLPFCQFDGRDVPLVRSGEFLVQTVMDEFGPQESTSTRVKIIGHCLR